jgi:hypothetical protein
MTSVIERRLHLGPDEQILLSGFADGAGTAHVTLQLCRRPPDSVDPHDYHAVGAGVRIPAHLSEVVGEELLKVAQRTVEAVRTAATATGSPPTAVSSG